MEQQKDPQQGVKKEKEQFSEEYLRINSRMYENVYPKKDDLVMCYISEIQEDGADVQLLEYNRVKGMLLSSEISRKRINYVKKYIKEGREEVLRVLRIDEKKGYVDLSKKSVKVEEIEEFKEKYQKAKTVHAIMRLLSYKTHCPIEELYAEFCWPLYKIHGNAFYAFKEALNDEEAIFSKVTIRPEIRKALMEILKVRMVPEQLKIRADFKLTCYKYEGIDAIKYALLEGEKLSTSEFTIKFRMIGSPLYECTMLTINKIGGIKLMGEALKVVEQCIKSKEGSFLLQTNPSVLGEAEADIKDQIKEAKAKNQAEVEEEEESEEDNDEGIKANIDENNDDEDLKINRI